MNLIPSLQLGDLLGKKARTALFSGHNNVYYYSLGRAALLNGVQLLAQQKPGRRTIIVPAFICEETLWPLRDAGYKIDYYSIDDKLNFSLAQIAAKVDKETLAVIAVHYFGIPAMTVGLKDLCAGKGVYLIEDCAHSFIGRGIGQTGDISFFSPRKFLPLPDGGALVINETSLQIAAAQLKIEPNNSRGAILKSFARAVKNWIKTKLPIKPRALTGDETIESLCPRADLEDERTRFRPLERMSIFSRRVMACQNISVIAVKRLNNYNKLACELSKVKSVSIPALELAAEQAPYALPIFVPASVQLRVIKMLILVGIGATDWPLLPFDLPKPEKEQAEELARRIILLPVHQQINCRTREQIAQVIREVFA